MPTRPEERKQPNGTPPDKRSGATPDDEVVAPVKDFDPGKAIKGRRIFPNGDTDRTDTRPPQGR